MASGKNTLYYQFCGTQSFANLCGDVASPAPVSVGSFHTPDHESPEILELQGWGHEVGGRERQQTTRYTSATLWALPNQRLFPN